MTVLEYLKNIGVELHRAPCMGQPYRTMADHQVRSI